MDFLFLALLIISLLTLVGALVPMFMGKRSIEGEVRHDRTY